MIFTIKYSQSQKSTYTCGIFFVYDLPVAICHNIISTYDIIIVGVFLKNIGIKESKESEITGVCHFCNTVFSISFLLLSS